MVNWLRAKYIEYEENLPFSVITGINSEGVCKVFCQPKSIEELKQVILYGLDNNVLFDVVGELSNTYLLKTYSPQLLISTVKVRDFEINNDTAICACGCSLTKFAKWCVDQGISGYEGFVGIPGTVGAAAINNSGAFQSSMANVVKSVTIITGGNAICTLFNANMKYSARESVLKRKEIIGYVLSVELDISKKENKGLLAKKCGINIDYRKKYIDSFKKNLGSVFVATTLRYLYSEQKLRFLCKKVCFAFFKLFVSDSKKLWKINTYFDFLFLGVPGLAKHCDGLNLFCWDQKTAERDFLKYINTMQRLAKNKLKLEIDIKS